MQLQQGIGGEKIPSRTIFDCFLLRLWNVSGKTHTIETKSTVFVTIVFWRFSSICWLLIASGVPSNRAYIFTNFPLWTTKSKWVIPFTCCAFKLIQNDQCSRIRTSFFASHMKRSYPFCILERCFTIIRYSRSNRLLLKIKVFFVSIIWKVLMQV